MLEIRGAAVPSPLKKQPRKHPGEAKEVPAILAQSVSDISAANVVNQQTWVTPGDSTKEGLP